MGPFLQSSTEGSENRSLISRSWARRGSPNLLTSFASARPRLGWAEGNVRTPAVVDVTPQGQASTRRADSEPDRPWKRFPFRPMGTTVVVPRYPFNCQESRVVRRSCIRPVAGGRRRKPSTMNTVVWIVPYRRVRRKCAPNLTTPVVLAIPSGDDRLSRDFSYDKRWHAAKSRSRLSRAVTVDGRKS